MTSTIKVNNIQNQCGANIANKCGTTVTLGASGDTITLACGASQTGFGRTGTVDWNTTKITADPANAVSGTGYFADTTSSAFTITLPTSPSAGDIVAISDYASNFGTNNLTVGRNGSNIEGNASDYILNKSGVSVTLVYVDATKGWIVTNAGNSSQGFGSDFIIATGGTITCCGDYKIHTFTGPGTFCVSSAGSPSGSTTVEYLVVAGGGSGSAKGPGDGGGGGGAGGFRFASPTLAPLTFPGKPLNGPSAITVTATAFPITVGGGGSGASDPGGPCAPAGNGADGSNSIFSSIISTGGGKGGYSPSRAAGTGSPGGSGGGGNAGNPTPVSGGTGNTPPVSPPQGNNGGSSIFPSSPNSQGGAGGGATAVGANGSPAVAAGGAGAGLPTGFGANGESCGSFRYYAGGGAGGRKEPANGSGGVGGGGDTNAAGTDNTGGGGGGGGANGSSAAGTNGGSGIVIIRYKFQ
jgi:hypothetical protein